MLGPYDRIDLWLDRRLAALNSAEPSTSRDIGRMLLSFSLALVAIITGLVSLLWSARVIHVELRPLGVGLVGVVPSVLALVGWAVAVFVFGYVVHLSKRWLRAGRPKPTAGP